MLLQIIFIHKSRTKLNTSNPDSGLNFHVYDVIDAINSRKPANITSAFFERVAARFADLTHNTDNPNDILKREEFDAGFLNYSIDVDRKLNQWMNENPDEWHKCNEQKHQVQVFLWGFNNKFQLG